MPRTRFPFPQRRQTAHNAPQAAQAALQPADFDACAEAMEAAALTLRQAAQEWRDARALAEQTGDYHTGTGRAIDAMTRAGEAIAPVTSALDRIRQAAPPQEAVKSLANILRNAPRK